MDPTGSQSWSFNFDFQFGGTQPDWGSPGVGAGIVPLTGTDTTFGLDLTFAGGGPIDAASIALGNASGCAGSSGGGTTFCTISPTDIWIAILTGPDSIEFRAQNPTFFLTPGQSYFVNVFFDGDTPDSFTGKLLTEFSPGVPEPSTWAMMALGFAGLSFVSYRKTRSQSAFAA